ncbi:unnamed protein product [Calicophoron daubneyi]|uniref:Uncharacterized protein n=1 Tax=Calicophoron daubneyi TaxID=300641 RepID=A0AAV2T8C8_CALDB
MFEDTSWDDSEVQGFQFDWDDSHQCQNTNPFIDDCNFVLANTFVDQEAITAEVEGQMCAMCHKLIKEAILYEKNCAFCSEYCWRSLLCAALDDFAVGGMSAWPLDTFISYAAKSFLLDLATKSYDGNMIVKILHQFQLSLSQETFRRLLLENRVAFNHFTNFARKTGQHEVLHEFLMAKGDTERAKIQPYQQITCELDTIDSTNADELVHRLRIFAMTELDNNPKLALLHKATVQLAELLQFQYQYQSEWNRFCQNLAVSNSASESGTNLPTDSLLAVPLSETIRACAWMDGSLSNGTRADHLRTQFKVSDDQFKWLSIEPLVMSENWAELDSVLLEKKLLKRRVRTKLPNDRLVLYLHSLNAPPDIIGSYLSYSNDTDELIETALRLNMYQIALDCCLKTRNPQVMRELLSRIPKKEPESAKIVHYLSIPASGFMHSIERESVFYRLLYEQVGSW